VRALELGIEIGRLVAGPANAPHAFAISAALSVGGADGLVGKAHTS